MVSLSSDLQMGVIYKAQSALGTKATAASAQILRRVDSTLDLQKASFEANEIRPSQQVNDMRHGLRSVTGTVTGELSPGTYQDWIEAGLRGTWATAVTSGAIATVTAAAAGPQYVDSGSGFLTAGFKVGMVIRWTGFVATNNNSNNFLITAVTAGNMTGVHLNGEAVTAEAEGATVTGLEVGQHVQTPLTGHVIPYYTVEHDYADITQAEQLVDCRVDGFKIGISSTGMATIDFPMVGLSRDTSTSAYFTTPTAVTSTTILAGPSGTVYIDGAAVAIVTGIGDITVAGGMVSAGAVVGTDVAPDVLPDTLSVKGTMSIFFTDATYRDAFQDETEVAINIVLTTSKTLDAADFISITMPRVKFTGATKATQSNAKVLNLPFQSLENTAGIAGTDTYPGSITIQDSQAS